MNKTIPLSVPNLSMNILNNIKETIETGWVSTGGRFIDEFENKVANYVGVKKAISCQSGTAGLHLALKVLEIGEGDEIIVPTLTFIAAVNPVKYVGAEPIFMDCDDTLNMDMKKLEQFIEKECLFLNGKVINKVTKKRIKAVIVVHVFGNPANMKKLMEICKKYDLKVIEDSTEALGSYFIEGKFKNKFCGTIGDIGIYSFNANKIITTGGGGMIVSNNEELLEKISYLSIQAKSDSLYFVHDEIGYNYRMTNIQAAFGVSQIDDLEGFINTKISNYNLYKDLLNDINGLYLLNFRNDTRSNYWFYSLIVDEHNFGIDRDELLYLLIKNSIQVRPLWKLIHKQKPYKKSLSYKVEKANYFEKSVINIPCSSNLLNKDIEEVVRNFILIVNNKEEKKNLYLIS